MAKKAKTSRKATGTVDAGDAMAEPTPSIKRAARRSPKRTGKGKRTLVRKDKAAALTIVELGAGRALERIKSIVARPVTPKINRAKLRLGHLERLEFAIDEVRHGARTSPRTRKLQLSGLPKMAQKVIEEAGEVAIEAIQGNRVALVSECVDLIYNLLVLLSASSVTLDQVWGEMDRRELTLGMAEKVPKVVDPDG